jgi:hypothetical protein
MWTGREAPSVVGIHTGTLEAPMATTTPTTIASFGMDRIDSRNG